MNLHGNFQKWSLVVWYVVSRSLKFDIDFDGPANDLRDSYLRD